MEYATEQRNGTQLFSCVPFSMPENGKRRKRVSIKNQLHAAPERGKRIVSQEEAAIERFLENTRHMIIFKEY